MVAPAAAPSDSAALERRVLDVVAALVAELGGPAASRPPTLDDALDRDLGLGSLERVELLLRLEHACGVRLADDVMERADTPRDLVAALATASPAMPEPLAAPRPAVGSGPPAPVTARTLSEVLHWHRHELYVDIASPFPSGLGHVRGERVPHAGRVAGRERVMKTCGTHSRATPTSRNPPTCVTIGTPLISLGRRVPRLSGRRTIATRSRSCSR